jgi:hypothetical protein
MGTGFRDWMPWLAGLPLSLDLGGFRAVHAAWHEAGIAELRDAGPLVRETLVKYGKQGSRAYKTITRILNGPEALLPEGKAYQAADGILRREIRVKWWRDVKNLDAREAIFPDDPHLHPHPLEKIPENHFDPGAPITFFGHYAVKSPVPMPVSARLACLDYAIGKGGYLAAYRWDGETDLNPANFVSVNQKSVYQANPEKQELPWEI